MISHVIDIYFSLSLSVIHHCLTLTFAVGLLCGISLFIQLGGFRNHIAIQLGLREDSATSCDWDSIMHQPRVGYNDKARGSTAGGRKGKRRNQPSKQTDPNVTIHVPKTTEERQMEKKERMKQDVCLFSMSLFQSINCSTKLVAQSDSKMNSKKKKRLEKYIVSAT